VERTVRAPRSADVLCGWSSRNSAPERAICARVSRRALVISGFPEVRYADADGVSIAYSVRGDGPVDIVRVPGSWTTIVGSALDPVVDSHYEGLARFARLIVIDRRGHGLSDPPVEGTTPPLEQQVGDLVAVMDAVGSVRAAVYAGQQSGPVGLLFAAMHPDRVSAVVLLNTYARFFGAGDYPYGPPLPPDDQLLADASEARRQWGDLEAPAGIEWAALSRAADPAFPRILARVQQVAMSRYAANADVLVNAHADVRSVLELIQSPTLVLCAADLEHLVGPAGLGASQYLVDHIPDARLALFPGADIYFGEHTPEIGALIEEFLTGARPTEVSDRSLATVLFTDVVSSTEQLAHVGDRRWKSRLDQHDAMVRDELARFKGREVNTTGDGFFATFDGPARAVRCAQAIVEGARSLGVEVRAGVHVGECEKRGNDLTGIAVHIGARVCALAPPGQVYATTTVRDLVTGSGIEFSDKGRHTLKGVPGEWEILAAVS
jgi:class 3 adenylate cyclase/pimeloyl-ACP methyl ester carboxylesterase